MDSSVLRVSTRFSRIFRTSSSSSFHSSKDPIIYHGPVKVINVKDTGKPKHLIGGGSQRFLPTQQAKSREDSSLFSHKHHKSRLVHATSGHHLQSDSNSFISSTTWESIQSSANAFYRFSRPHTIIGTALSIVSVSLLAVQSLSDLSPIFFIGLFEAIVAALFMNVYIVGLNQLTDIEIDKINKPYLPLASGEYSVQTGTFIVTGSAILSFAIGAMVQSWPLLWALFISFVLGTSYSINLPFLRWKRSAVVAAMCILVVRAVIVQLAFFLHMQTFVFGRVAFLTKPVIFATAFMTFFSVVIALFKDIPDIEGDRIWGIQSFSVRLGQKKVFWICIYLLQMAYAVAIAVGASSFSNWCRAVTILGHGFLAFFLWKRAKSVNLDSKGAITSFYMFIWKLFYTEYFLIPLVR